MYLFGLSSIIPVYGDPTRNIRVAEHVLAGQPPAVFGGEVVRPPLFYLVLAAFHSVDLSFLLPPIFIILLVLVIRKIHQKVGQDFTSFALLFPPMYILGTRAFADGLTILLFGILFFYILQDHKGGVRETFLYPSLIIGALIFTREISLTLPILVVLLILVVKRTARYAMLLIPFGVATVFLAVYVGATTSGSVTPQYLSTYILLGLSRPATLNLVDGFLTLFSPIIPSQIVVGDLAGYLPGSFIQFFDFADITNVVRIGVYVLTALIFFPFLVGVICIATRARELDFARFSLSVLAYAILIWTALTVIYTGVDAFRFASPVMPLMAYFGTVGLRSIERFSPPVAWVSKGALIFGAILWAVRTLRQFMDFGAG